jgi:hypothetical protein
VTQCPEALESLYLTLSLSLSCSSLERARLKPAEAQYEDGEQGPYDCASTRLTEYSAAPKHVFTSFYFPFQELTPNNLFTFLMHLDTTFLIIVQTSMHLKCTTSQSLLH